jgi:hypothetical protein
LRRFFLFIEKRRRPADGESAFAVPERKNAYPAAGTGRLYHARKERQGHLCRQGEEAQKPRHQYFRNVEKLLPKVYKMVEHVWDFDYIVTDIEFEALISSAP